MNPEEWQVFEPQLHPFLKLGRKWLLNEMELSEWLLSEMESKRSFPALCSVESPALKDIRIRLVYEGREWNANI